jgi:hypothetical protein
VSGGSRAVWWLRLRAVAAAAAANIDPRAGGRVRSGGCGCMRLRLTSIRERGGAGGLVDAVAAAAAADIDPRAGGRGRFGGCGSMRLRLAPIRKRGGASGLVAAAACGRG